MSAQIPLDSLLRLPHRVPTRTPQPGSLSIETDSAPFQVRPPLQTSSQHAPVGSFERVVDTSRGGLRARRHADPLAKAQWLAQFAGALRPRRPLPSGAQADRARYFHTVS